MSGAEPNNLTINVRMSTSARFTIGGASATITTASTVRQVKQIISNEEASGNCPAERQRLIYKGRILSEDTRTLSDYGIVEDDQTIHLVKGSAPTTPGETGTSTADTAPIGSGSPIEGGSAGNPFAAMMQMTQQQGGASGGMPDMNQIQQQMMQNPEMMNSLMNSPMMQSLMSNPDFILSTMESNPQMRQLLESNPELRHLLDDPEMMRRSMQMMRDPSAMQHMMRNQDLAMSQIENVPGGFAALRRMYEDVQEPMMNAMTGGAQATGAASNNNATNRASGTAMPNPWGGPSSSGASRTTPSSTPMPASNPWGGGGASNFLTAAGSGGVPNLNLEQTISMLENPTVNQMMNQMMSNPSAMQAMMDSNPMLRQIRETNPAAAAMMSNPEIMRSMMNPENLRAMTQMQNAMEQLGRNVPGFPGIPSMGGTLEGNPATSVGGSNSDQLDFSSLLNQFQSASLVGGSPSPMASRQQLPPEQRFRMQLQSLNDMGFDDNVANIAALTQTHGNVNRAVDVLFSTPSDSTLAPTPGDESTADHPADGNTAPGDKKND